MLMFQDDPKSPDVIIDNKLRSGAPCCKCGRIASREELGSGSWGADYRVEGGALVFDPLCPGCISPESKTRLDGVVELLFPPNTPIAKKLADKSIYYISMVRELTEQNLFDLGFTPEEVSKIKGSLKP